MKLISVNEISSDLLNELGCESNKIKVSFEKESGEMAYLECATFEKSTLLGNELLESDLVGLLGLVWALLTLMYISHKD